MNTAVLIPAYQPDKRLVVLVENLILNRFPVLIVDDGSTAEHLEIFEEIKERFNCQIIKHEFNQGKGKALKTGFEHLLENKEITGCITVDADGQHLIEDICKVASELKKHPQALVLGSRNFDVDIVPLKSRLGNKITRFVTRFLIGQNITDTQTGLRGLSRLSMEKMIDLPGDRYEFEMNMLLHAKKLNITIIEVTIQTVYLDDNKSSHFNALLDSFRIYKQIFRFAVASSLSSLIDLAVFRLLFHFMDLFGFQHVVLIATVIARAVSSLFNFFANRKAVFQQLGDLKKQLLSYYILALIIMFMSWWGVLQLSKIVSIDIIWIKLLVDSVLFMLSFTVQKKLIFRRD